MAIVTVPDVCGAKGCFSGTSKAFQRALVATAQAIGAAPGDLAAVIAFESGGSFSASIRNQWCVNAGRDPNSCATGLIQFMPTTARNLGTTTAKLAAMSNVQQLTWVRKFFAPYRQGFRNVSHLYFAVFLPSLIGKPLDEPAARRGEPTYEQNAGFDRTGKGYFTPRDVAAPVTSILAAAANRSPVLVDTDAPQLGWILLGAATGAALTWGGLTLLKS
jgi:hypothetical protein